MIIMHIVCRTLVTVGFSVSGILRLMGSPDELTGQAVGGGSLYTIWPLPFIMSVIWRKKDMWVQIQVNSYLHKLFLDL